MNQAFNDCLNGWNSLGKTFCGYAGSAFVQSALLVILLLALDVLWHKRVRAVVRYCVWLLVLLKLVLPPTLSLPTGIGYWVGDHLPAATGVSERVFPPMGEERMEQHLPAAAQASGALPAVPPPAEAPTLSAPAAPAILPPTSLTWQGVVLLFWSVGVLAFIALVAQRLRFVRGLVAASTPAGPELLGLLEECARQMGIRRPVALRTLDTLPSPAVCGLRRPTILLPTALVEKLSSEGLQAALIHELAHIKRADLWVNTVQTLLQIIYFYNPFVWLANAVIRRTCEEAVDETVLVTLGGRAKNYSNTLIDISEMAFWKADFGLRLVGVAESRRALQGRIKHMLTRPIPKSARIGTLGTIVILVVAAVLLPMARGTQVRQSGTSSLMDRLQKEDDPELGELIRMAVANHKGAGEKEILEITRRVTESHAQVLLLDAQIAQVTREIEATSTSAKTRGRLLLSRKELEAKRMIEMGNLREIVGIVPKVPFDKQRTGDLNTWLNLQVLDQRVVVYDALKPFQDYWALWRENVAGVLSEEATLDYIRGRLKDRKNLPMRITMNYRAESRSASERLRDAVFSLARETHTDMDVEVSLELIWWVSPTSDAPFFCQEGKIRTLYSTAMARPDGRATLFKKGLVVVDPNDLEQHVLWRLSYPGNVPLRLRIEYDQASAPLARQVAETIKTTAQRLDVAELVALQSVLVEPVPETAFLGRWEARRKGYFRAIDIQPQGVCQVTMDDGTDRFQAGASAKGTWMPTCKEILVDIGDGPRGYGSFSYLASINQRGNLVVDRTEIYNQGYFNVHNTGQMIFQKVK
jgi:beta-lactamase regulating signal transducer with metallopeptidase domain